MLSRAVTKGWGLGAGGWGLGAGSRGLGDGGQEPGTGGWGPGAGGCGWGLGARGQGFPPATMRVSPTYSTFLRNRKKMEPKELPSYTIPLLLIAYTWQLEILVTALVISI